MSNSELGKKLIRFWFEASEMKSKGKTLNDAYAYYSDTSRKTNRVSPTFVKSLGGAVRDSDLSDSRLREAMGSLAAHDPTGWPWYGSFFDALAGERLAFRYEDAVDVAKATVKDIGNVAKAGLGIYIGVLAVGMLIFLYPMFKRVRA